MTTETFHSVLASGHKGNAAEVPFDPCERWSVSAQPIRRGRRGVPVRAILDGNRFESAIVSRSRRFWLLVPVEVSELAGISVGDAGTFSVTPVVASRPARRKPRAA